jgi:hypothetical protein
VRNQKYEPVRRLKVKILFYGDNSLTVALRHMKFGMVADHLHKYKFHMNQCFVWLRFLIWRWREFWGCIGTNGEPLRIELWNFEQCHVKLSNLLNNARKVKGLVISITSSFCSLMCRILQASSSVLQLRVDLRRLHAVNMLHNALRLPATRRGGVPLCCWNELCLTYFGKGKGQLMWLSKNSSDKLKIQGTEKKDKNL